MGSSTENSAFGPTRNPLAPDARAGRLVGRIGRGRRRGHRSDRARLGDRRLGASAGGVLRHRRREADVRPREPLRPRRVRLVARPGRRLRRDRATTRRSALRRHRRTRSAATRPAPTIAGAATIATLAARVARRASSSGGRRSTSRATLDPRIRDALRRARSSGCARSARRCATSRCRTPTSRSRSTTSSRPPRRRRTSRASTACGTDCASRATGCAACTRRRARAGFGPEVTRRILLGTYVLSAGYYDAYYQKGAGRCAR